MGHPEWLESSSGTWGFGLSLACWVHGCQLWDTHATLLSLIQCVLRRVCLVVADVTGRRAAGGAAGRRDEVIYDDVGGNPDQGWPWPCTLEGTGRPNGAIVKLALEI